MSSMACFVVMVQLAGDYSSGTGSADIDILLGNDHYHDLVQPQRRQLSPTGWTPTSDGWCLAACQPQPHTPCRTPRLKTRPSSFCLHLQRLIHHRWTASGAWRQSGLKTHPTTPTTWWPQISSTSRLPFRMAATKLDGCGSRTMTFLTITPKLKAASRRFFTVFFEIQPRCNSTMASNFRHLAGYKDGTGTFCC